MGLLKATKICTSEQVSVEKKVTLIMIGRCNIFPICFTIFSIPAATFGIFEEIPLFDWASLENDVRSVPCELDDGGVSGWACFGNHETSARCHCDDNCAAYGDCCLDRAKTRLEERKTALYQVSLMTGFWFDLFFGI